MADFNKIIFVCKENVSLSPMAEWVTKSILMDKSKEIFSRGLVVLFPEPRSMKVTDVLARHGIPCGEQVSQEFDASEVDEHTLVITMNFQEKVKIVEDFGLEDRVYTLKEFVDEDGDVTDPYGGDEEVYDAFFLEIRDLLYKMKHRLGWS
jgi:protein-tyrosine-phosphatase